MFGNHGLTILLALCVVLAGCSGVGPAQQGADEGNGDGAGDSGGDVGGSGAGASSDWCPTGQSTSYTNPQTGERVSMEFQGVVSQDGREVCRAVWTTNDPESEVARIEWFFDEEGTYQRHVTYDADGNVVNEYQSSTGGGSDGETGPGDVDGTASDDWCVEGQSFSSSSSQTGEQVSFTVQGIVSHRGRQVCRAVWETSDPDGQVARIEWYYNEDQTYRHVVSYDSAGDVVYDQELTPMDG